MDPQNDEYSGKSRERITMKRTFRLGLPTAVPGGLPLVALAACLLAAAMTAMAEPADEIFHADETGRARLSLGKRLLVTGDGFDLNTGEYRDIVPGTEIDLETATEQTWSMHRQGWTGGIAAGSLPYGVVWTREIAVKGKVAEITLAAIVHPVDRGADVGCSRYTFRIPCAILAGSNYTYRYGMHRSGRPPGHGRLTGKEAEDKPVLTHIRQIQFTGGACDVMLDFAPCGVFGVALEDPSSAYKAHMFRRGSDYVFAVPSRNARYGGKVSHKIVFRAGQVDMDALHPVRVLHYTDPFPVFLRLQFTPEKHAVTGMARRPSQPGWDQEFIPVGLEPFQAGRGYGWLDAGTGELLAPKSTSELGPLFSGGVRGHGKCVFRLQHPNARVLVNLLFSGARGECRAKVRVNQGAERHVRVAPGRRQTLTIPTKVDRKIIDIDIEGDAWMLSGIVVQMLMSEAEDFLFGRTWWAFGKPPWRYHRFVGKQRWNEWPEAAFRPHDWPR